VPVNLRSFSLAILILLAPALAWGEPRRLEDGGMVERPHPKYRAGDLVLIRPDQTREYALALFAGAYVRADHPRESRSLIAYAPLKADLTDEQVLQALRSPPSKRKRFFDQSAIAVLPGANVSPLSAVDKGIDVKAVRLGIGGGAVSRGTLLASARNLLSGKGKVYVVESSSPAKGETGPLFLASGKLCSKSFFSIVADRFP